jgi:hypothetical protein
MVVTIDGCDGARAFVGPVSTYHSVLTEGFQRLTDSEWLSRVEGSDTTSGWTASYRQ